VTSWRSLISALTWFRLLPYDHWGRAANHAKATSNRRSRSLSSSTASSRLASSTWSPSRTSENRASRASGCVLRETRPETRGRVNDTHTSGHEGNALNVPHALCRCRGPEKEPDERKHETLLPVLDRLEPTREHLDEEQVGREQSLSSSERLVHDLLV
jgi:hypothetical protein